MCKNRISPQRTFLYPVRGELLYPNLTTSGALVKELKVAVASLK